MIVALVLLTVLALVGIVGTIRLVAIDGYRRTPDRAIRSEPVTPSR